ncbi:tyrosine protein kinase, partial [Bacillus cereus]|nr:tyrosine protein kinase [Bacillus cereus]
LRTVQKVIPDINRKECEISGIILDS